MTHQMWMDDPLRIKNCHFLETTYMITVLQLIQTRTLIQRLNGIILKADCQIKLVKKQLKKIIWHAKTIWIISIYKSDSRIIYPFKNDCVTGEFLNSELENNLLKNVTHEKGKARATGFTIPVLSRLPKIFLDTYVIKC